ncbi:MAG: DMT family transporter [Sulfuritalea sp.]|jgi:drug/metabolite transporter (DMT)-like permease|nr:DMT family transporter [Sulfuritalea sp.]
MTPEHRNHRRGTLYMLLVIAIWGGFLPVGKSALQAVDPYWLTAMRFSTAALVFIGLLWVREGRAALRTEGQFWKIVLFGTLGFAGFGVCLFEGLKLTRPEISGMILALGPIQVALFQWWRTHRRPDNFTLGAIALALFGELFVITAGDVTRLTGGDALGNGLVFLASLFWTAYTLGGQQFPGWSPVRYTTLSCSLGCFAILVAVAIATLAGHSQPPTTTKMLEVWPQLAFLILFASVFGILFWNMGVAKLGPLNAGLFANFTPVITYLIAIYQGRRPAAIELMGAAIVLVALIANNRHQYAKVHRIEG